MIGASGISSTHEFAFGVFVFVLTQIDFGLTFTLTDSGVAEMYLYLMKH